MKSYVYYVENRVNNKRYVGKSNDPENRLKGHIKKALNENSQLAFHCAIRKHGIENFVIHVYGEYESEEKAYDAETQLIREWKTTKVGYNMNEGGVGGINPTDAVKKKISDALMGKKHTNNSIKQMSEVKLGDKNPMHGRKHSEETKAKMRAARQRMREEGRDKMTDEQRQKLRDAWTRNPDRKPWNAGKKGVYSEEYRNKIGDGHRGIPLTEEHKQKLREVARKRREKNVS